MVVIRDGGHRYVQVIDPYNLTIKQVFKVLAGGVSQAKVSNDAVRGRCDFFFGTKILTIGHTQPAFLLLQPVPVGR